jgi:VWFA-related protein
MIVPRALIALVCLSLLAQETPIIRTKVTQVLVPVNVTDSKGNVIEGLKTEDFALRDDGIAVQQIQVDTSDTLQSPVDMAVAVQTNSYAQSAIEKLRHAGGMFQPLVEGDKGQVAVIAYDEDVRVLQDFTRESAKIKLPFQLINGRNTKTEKLYDAVAKASDMLRAREGSSRRVLVILGESRDRGSKLRLSDAISAIDRANVTVYSITYSTQATAWTSSPADNPPLPGGPDYSGGVVELKRKIGTNAANDFAKASGGRHLSFARVQGLEESIAKLGTELNSQYLLSFTPPDSSNTGFHPLLVGVRGHPKAVIRARPGYWPK